MNEGERRRTTEGAVSPPSRASEPRVRLPWREGLRLPGDIQLLTRIGVGGMGEVWRANSLRLERLVAVKVLYAEGEGIRENVLREARAIARLRHPAIVQVFDAQVDADERPFVVMEWLDGRDLADIVERHARLSPITAVRVMLPVAEGLAHAHAMGVLHRDVKPENVVLTRLAGGTIHQPKLIDFGIARLDGGSARESRLVGTPDFMAPEQLVGAELGPAVDQWAFAVTLYCLLTGRLPFNGSDAERARAICESPLPYPRDLDLDGGLFSVLARALRKDPRDRFEDFDALAAALRHWLIDRGANDDITGRSLRRNESREAARRAGDPIR